jgi:tryptophanyl-tRNA synthetase
MTQKRLVSGIQPTGKIHLGNYLGAVQNWVQCQDTFDSFLMIADLHALTSLYESPQKLAVQTQDLALDLLAIGIDPQKSCLFIQSQVPQHAELHVLLSMVTPLSWLHRVPTYKGKMENIDDKDLGTYGFLGYPVLQTADILLYQAQSVPVGKDQLPHLELCREIIRRLNHLTGLELPLPEEVLTPHAVLPGLDGRKMSKSYANTIPLNDSAENTQKLVMSMITDPQRVKKTDPGNPDICPVFTYQKIFNTPTRQTEIKGLCQNGEIGCVACKKECAEHIIESLGPIRKKRNELADNPDYVQSLFKANAQKAQHEAEITLKKVKSALCLPE